MTNRFELTEETYDIAYPAFRHPIPVSPRKRLFLSEEDMTTMQKAFAYFLDNADSRTKSSKEYKDIERFGYVFEDLKRKLK